MLPLAVLACDRGVVCRRYAHRYKQKQAAFRATTLGLQQIRRAACRLVECVAEWQTVEAKEFGNARQLITQRVKSGEAAKPTPPIIGKPWPREDYLPPPFFWNGDDVLVKLISSLDFLDAVPELGEWYQGLRFTRNPFVLAVGGCVWVRGGGALHATAQTLVDLT